MDHGRLHWYEPDELPVEGRRLYDAIIGGPRGQGPQVSPLTDEAGRLHGPFNALLVAPHIGSAVAEVGSKLRFVGGLTAREREIAILAFAARRKSEFEWYAHALLGRQAGLTDAEIDALRIGAASATFDAAETLVRTIVEELVDERDIGDERFREAAATLGTPVLVELVLLVGHYDLLALSMQVFRVPLPAGNAPVFGAPGGA